MAKIRETETDSLPENDPDFEGMEDSPIEALLSDLEGIEDATVKIYREDDPAFPGKQVYVGTMTPAEFSLERVQSQYGGGLFRVQVKRGGRWIRGGNRQLAIAKPPNATPTAPKTETSHDAIIIKVLEEMRDMRREFQTHSQPAPVAPPLQLPELVAMFAQLSSVFKPAVSASAPSIDGMVDVLQKGIELGKMVNGNSTGETDTNAVLVEAIRALGPALAHGLVNRPAPQPITQPVYAANPAPTAIPSPVEKKVNDMDLMLLTAVSRLMSAAKRGSDPTAYAIVLLDELDENAQATLYEFIQNPRWLERLNSFAPQTTPYNQWFIDLRDCLLTAEEPADNPLTTVDAPDIIDTSGVMVSDGGIESDDKPNPERS